MHAFQVKSLLHGFNGAGGFTLTVKNENFTASYCHVSPNFLYKVGDYITSKSIVAYVGPKNVYNVIGNPYKDSNGNPTNGATTGCHLHLTIKKDGQAVNPLNYFSSESSSQSISKISPHSGQQTSLISSS